MKIKKTYSEEEISIMPLEGKIKVLTEIVTNPDFTLKQKRRIKAMKNEKTEWHLDSRKMESRLALAQKSIAARETKNVITNAQQINNGIYCSKTGAFIGRIDVNVLSIVNELEMPFPEGTNAIAQWQTHHAVHPAWLNTSPSVLAQLQRIMPHEYVVYLYTYLIERNAEACQSVVRTMVEVKENKWHEMRTTCITSIPAPYKHHLLNQLYAAPLAEVIEIAELLRILAALMGKCKAIITAMPKMAIQESLFVDKFRSELSAFLRMALKKQQKQHHSRDIERANLITSADLYEIVTSNGMKTFGAAKIKPDDDNPVLGDVADLFHEAGLSPVTVAKHYSKVKAKTPDKKPKHKFKTELITSANTKPTNANASPANDNPENANPVFELNPITL